MKLSTWSIVNDIKKFGKRFKCKLELWNSDCLEYATINEYALTCKNCEVSNNEFIQIIELKDISVNLVLHRKCKTLSTLWRKLINMLQSKYKVVYTKNGIAAILPEKASNVDSTLKIELKAKIICK